MELLKMECVQLEPLLAQVNIVHLMFVGFNSFCLSQQLWRRICIGTRLVRLYFNVSLWLLLSAILCSVFLTERTCSIFIIFKALLNKELKSLKISSFSFDDRHCCSTWCVLTINRYQ